ncbi:D-cysteine desulfhydrase [Cedecea neteri]|uniref:D-cysteine desulfhydrase n=1 Tax=Cedecea neteri TaxID=158822 RepID=A0A2X3L1J5_9ENTR|nr:D-cysteine desulfhydrase [Cedecea neteri]
MEDGFVGSAYGVPSDGGIEAIYQVAQQEGVLLDPVYTGKAMHGLITLAKEGRIAADSSVIFMHCGGSRRFIRSLKNFWSTDHADSEPSAGSRTRRQ